jgi:replicative DNA helicase
VAAVSYFDDEPEPSGEEYSVLHDPRAERAALGAMLSSSKAIPEVTSLIGASSYIEPRHGEIHAAIVAVHEAGKTPDFVTVCDELRRLGRLEKVGGPGYVMRLPEAVGTWNQGGHYAEIVQRWAALAEFGDLGTWMRQLARNPDTDIDDIPELFAEIKRRVASAEARGHRKEIPWISTLIEPTLDVVEHAPAERRIRTGLPELDGVWKGPKPGHLDVIAARPGYGKTVMGLQLGRTAAVTQNVRTLFASCEITAEEAMMRLFASQAGVEIGHLTESACTDRDWQRLARAVAVLDRAPLAIDYCPGLSVPGLRQKILDMQADGGCGLAIVDHLGRMGMPKAPSTQEATAATIKAVKLLAQELEVPIIMLCQINRGPEQRSDKRPMVSDLRDSGAIEMEADTVILLNRPDIAEKDQTRAGEIDIEVGKDRHGPGGTVNLAFQGHYSRVVSMFDDRHAPASTGDNR